MRRIFTKEFWLATFERAVNTFAQVLVGFLAITGVPTGFADIDWTTTFSVAGVATLVSVLKSIIVNTATGDGPGIGDVETLSK